MTLLYRLQTRAGLTGPEARAAVVLVLALAGGLAAQQWQAAATPVAPDFYASADAAFRTADAPTAAGPVHLASAPAPGQTRAAGAADTLGAEAWAADSTATPDPAAALAETAEAPAALADAAVSASARRSSSRKPPPVPTNINTASADELQRLPRIGPALAARILDYRRTHGRFRSAAELTEVRGIGDRTMEKLAPWVHV